MLERIASTSFRHRWRVLGLWLVALVTLTAAASSLSGEFSEGGRLDGTDSQEAYDLLEVDASAEKMEERAAGLTAAGVQTHFGGWLFEEFGMPASEVIGLAAAVLILLLAFGSVVAMGMPIATALAGVFAAVPGIGLWAALVETPDFVGPVATMIGLGVGMETHISSIFGRLGLTPSDTEHRRVLAVLSWLQSG